MRGALTDFFITNKKIIKNYAQKTKTYSALRFIFELSFVAIIGKMLIGLACFAVASIFVDINVNNLPTRFKNPSSPVFLFFLLCVIVPIFETIIFQWLPIKFLRKITSSITFIIIADAILFTLAHWPLGFAYMMIVLPVAIIFAWSWIVYNNSFSKALGVTASMHALINFSAIMPIMFF